MAATLLSEAASKAHEMSMFFAMIEQCCRKFDEDPTERIKMRALMAEFCTFHVMGSRLKETAKFLDRGVPIGAAQYIATGCLDMLHAHARLKVVS